MEYIDTHHPILERYYDAFIKKSGNIIKETAEGINSGAQRTLVRISPYVVTYTSPKYAKILNEYKNKILHEDKRMFLAVSNLAFNPKTIYEMCFEIIKYTIERTPKKTQEEFISKYKKAYITGTDLIALKAVEQATKIAIIVIISRLIAHRLANRTAVMAAASKLTGASLTAFQIYGVVTKAGLAADKLRKEERIIYNILYSKNIEMLYFLIEPQISPLISITKINDHTNADALIETLAVIFHRE